MPQAQYPNSGALELAEAIQGLMADSVIHLYKAPLSLTPILTLADCEAQEADYDGYAPKTVTAFNTPYLDPAGGATTASGYDQFNYGPAASPPVTNNIYGLFVTTSEGDLLIVFAFDNPAPMAQVGDSVPVNVLLNFGK